MNSKDKLDDTELYKRIADEYLLTKSVKKVVESLNTNSIKVRRVLITEGLWESQTSRNVGALHSAGKSVKEIAKELCMSEKNVQSYLPYTRGAYGGAKSLDAKRSDDYRKRMEQAANNQVAIKGLDGKEFIEADMSEMDNIIYFSERNQKEEEKKGNRPDRMPNAYRLRFQLVSPYYYRTNDNLLDMLPEEEKTFLKLAKAEKGIIREVIVNREMNLHAMHYMIQKLFGWQNSHLHHFSLAQGDFDKVTNGKRVLDYLDFCGSIFRFPGAELNDQFWDDDYSEGQSFKSWLRSKYVHGYYDYSVENSFLRNIEHVRRFKVEYKDVLRDKKMSIEDLGRMLIFENDFNTIIEGLPVCELFKAGGYGKGSIIDRRWKEKQEAIIQKERIKYDTMRANDPKEYNAILEDMQELIDLRTNILNIESEIRYGNAARVRKFYKKDPKKVMEEQGEMVNHLEMYLDDYMSGGNPEVIPFAEELYYNYDYGDDWCVKITCLDSYKAVDRFGNDFIDSKGDKVSPDLIEKLQKVVLDMEPVCLMADGLNVMDDVGGLHGYFEFLRTVNSKAPEDLEEKENMRQWARGMGWTGRKSKAENMV